MGISIQQWRCSIGSNLTYCSEVKKKIIQESFNISSSRSTLCIFSIFILLCTAALYPYNIGKSVSNIIQSRSTRTTARAYPCTTPAFTRPNYSPCLNLVGGLPWKPLSAQCRSFPAKSTSASYPENASLYQFQNMIFKSSSTVFSLWLRISKQSSPMGTGRVMVSR